MSLTNTEKVLVVALVATIIISATLLWTMRRIPTRGTLINIGLEVYWDNTATEPVEFIEWGELRPSETVGVTVYCQNTGSTNITMSMNSSAWQPIEAEQYLTLAWDYRNQTLYPNDIIAVLLTLAASPTTEGVKAFTFDINIWATEI